MKIVPVKRQMPKPVKLIKRIGNGGSGALIQSTAVLSTNDQHFILLRSIGVYGKSWRLTTCGFIICAHAGMHRITAQC